MIVFKHLLYIKLHKLTYIDIMRHRPKLDFCNKQTGKNYEDTAEGSFC